MLVDVSLLIQFYVPKDLIHAKYAEEKQTFRFGHEKKQ